jgi:DNA-binding transcriptional LysR family regulator
VETLANLESFVRSAETGGFSAAARRLTLTPAAVSRSLAMLERNLGVRLFQRSTRKLTLTEAGERFLHAIRDDLERLQAAIAGVASDRGEPAGVLKVSMGVPHALPHLESGALVRLVPQWYVDGGPISIYYASRKLLPAKTRVFVDFVVEAFQHDRMEQRFAGSLG